MTVIVLNAIYLYLNIYRQSRMKLRDVGKRSGTCRNLGCPSCCKSHWHFGKDTLHCTLSEAFLKFGKIIKSRLKSILAQKCAFK